MSDNRQGHPHAWGAKPNPVTQFLGLLDPQRFDFPICFGYCVPIEEAAIRCDFGGKPCLLASFVGGAYPNKTKTRRHTRQYLCVTMTGQCPLFDDTKLLPPALFGVQ